MTDKDFFTKQSLLNACLLVLLLAVGAFLLFYNLNHYYLWSDEGETAVYAKNILKFGLPYSFDGRNALFLNNSMLPMLEPWFVLYAAALSLQLFGTDGIRILFAFTGLAAMFMQYFFVRRYFENNRLALINLLLIVTSVQYLLFARQCRYYSFVMLLAPAIWYFYLSYKDRWWEIILSSLLFTLFFFSNYIVAITFLFSLALSLFIFDNRAKAVSFFLKPLPLTIVICGGFLFWLYHLNGGTDHNPYLFRNIHPANFLKMIWLYLKDYNLLQLLPFSIMIGLSILWGRDAALQKKDFLKNNGKCLSLVFFIATYTVVISILSTSPVEDRHSGIRYATAILPSLLLLQALFVERVYLLRKWTMSILLFVLIFTNLFTVLPYRSYFFEYLRENSRPFDNSLKTAVMFLEQNSRRDDLIYIAQSFMIGSMQFYLGDKLLFCSTMYRDETSLPDNIKEKKYLYSRDVMPRWIVLFGSQIKPETETFLKKIKPADYRVHVLPVFGHDVSRPEIFWRSFVPVRHFNTSESLLILEKKNSGN